MLPVPIWRQGSKAHSRPHSLAGGGDSPRTEDELGLRGVSGTELNYPKRGSGPVVDRAREERPILEVKQNFLVS